MHSDLLSLAAFKILSSSLIFDILIVMFLSGGFILLGSLCPSWAYMSFLFSILGKFSAIIFSYRFSVHFSLFSFWDPYIVNATMFSVVVLEVF